MKDKKHQPTRFHNKMDDDEYQRYTKKIEKTKHLVSEITAGPRVVAKIAKAAYEHYAHDDKKHKPRSHTQGK